MRAWERHYYVDFGTLVEAEDASGLTGSPMTVDPPRIEATPTDPNIDEEETKKENERIRKMLLEDAREAARSSRKYQEFVPLDRIEYYEPAGKRWEIEFKVEESESADANSASLVIKNATPERLRKLKTYSHLTIHAGYGRHTSQLIECKIEDMWTETEGSDRVTNFELTGMGDDVLRRKAWGTWRPGVLRSTVAQDLLEQLGLPIGIFEVGRDATYPTGKRFSQVVTIRRALEQVARDTESQFYETRGVAYFRPINAGDFSPLVLQPPPYGPLVGIPEEVRREKGQSMMSEEGESDVAIKAYHVESLLDAIFKPLFRFTVSCETLTALLTVKHVTHICNRTEYRSKMECSKNEEPEESGLDQMLRGVGDIVPRLIKEVVGGTE